MEENRILKETITSEEEIAEDDGSNISTSDTFDSEDDGSDISTSDTENTLGTPSSDSLESQREEYERLIKTRFKALYGEDTQRLINRRFRKYRVMEERYHILEENYKLLEQTAAESEKKLKEMSEKMATEGARLAKETEERVLSDIRSRRLRPDENGLSGAVINQRSDVSRLTKSERARLARRAADGEKISF